MTSFLHEPRNSSISAKVVAVLRFNSDSRLSMGVPGTQYLSMTCRKPRQLCRELHMASPELHCAMSLIRDLDSGWRAVALRGSRPRFPGLDLAIAGRRVGHQRAQQFARRLGHLLDGMLERRLVGFRGPREAAQLAHELQRGGADFLLGGRRVVVAQRLDISKHCDPPPCPTASPPGREMGTGYLRTPYHL